MELKGTRKGSVLTIQLNGELDHHSAEIIRSNIDAVLRDAGIRELVLDLKNVSFMDSSGLGVVLGRYRVMSLRGGTVKVANVSAGIDRIFKMSGIYSLVQRA